MLRLATPEAAFETNFANSLLFGYCSVCSVDLVVRKIGFVGLVRVDDCNFNISSVCFPVHMAPGRWAG